MSASDTELTPDDIFEILSNHRRRMGLYHLRRRGGSATVNELAEEIAALENEIPVEELGSQQRKRVYVSLYQTHLPKMESAGVIEYDVEEGVVDLPEGTSGVDKYLTNREGPTYPWTYHYAGLTVFASAVLALSLTNLPVFGAIPTVAAAVLALVLYAGSAGTQYLLRRRRRAEIPVELIWHDQ